MSDPIDEAWERVVASWNDERAHKAFVTLCAATERLGEAGKRYREVRECDPERAEIAQVQIDRVLGMALAGLTALRSEPPKHTAKTKLLLIALGVSGAMILSALWALLRTL